MLSLLLVWPIRIALYHGDLFKTGGSDTGAGNTIFGVAALAFTAWSTALLVVGVRAVHRWSWGRAALAAAVAALLPALVALASVL